MKHLYILALAIIALLFSAPSLYAAGFGPVDQAALSATRDLRFGMRGDAVVSLQNFLSSETDLDPSIYPSRSVTGYFGSLTQSALTRWQLKHGLSSTGIFDAKTKNAALPSKPAVAKNDLPTIPSGDVKSGNVDYSAALSAAMGTTFSLEEINFMRSAYGTVLPVPEILNRLNADLKSSNSSGRDNDLRALSIWRSYFERSYASLSSVKVPVSVANSHRHLLQWFAYNRSFLASAASITSVNGASAAYKSYQSIYNARQNDIQTSFLSKEAVASLAKPSFLARAKTMIQEWFSPQAQADDTSSSTSNEERKLFEDFAKEAAKQALVTAVKQIFIMPFGGKIAISDVCINGELLTIQGPASGQVYLYWVVYALNPFPYRAVITGNQILGNAFRYPGVCTHSGEDYELEGQAFILYFGTSKTPVG